MKDYPNNKWFKLCSQDWPLEFASGMDHAISSTSLNSCFWDFITVVKKSPNDFFITRISRNARALAWQWHSEDHHFSMFMSSTFKTYFAFLLLGKCFSTYSCWHVLHDLLRLPKVVDVSPSSSLVSFITILDFKKCVLFRRAISVTHLNHKYIGHHSSLETYIKLNEKLIR